MNEYTCIIAIGYEVRSLKKTDLALKIKISHAFFKIRDGPFDIQRGLGFFLATSYFFSLFAQQVIFFKSKLQQVFFLNNTLKSEKCK